MNIRERKRLFGQAVMILGVVSVIAIGILFAIFIPIGGLPVTFIAVAVGSLITSIGVYFYGKNDPTTQINRYFGAGNIDTLSPPTILAKLNGLDAAFPEASETKEFVESIKGLAVRMVLVNVKNRLELQKLKGSDLPVLKEFTKKVREIANSLPGGLGTVDNNLDEDLAEYLTYIESAYLPANMGASGGLGVASSTAGTTDAAFSSVKPADHEGAAEALLTKTSSRPGRSSSSS